MYFSEAGDTEGRINSGTYRKSGKAWDSVTAGFGLLSFVDVLTMSCMPNPAKLVQVTLPTPLLYKGVLTTSVLVWLTGFKLRSASAVSDYWCQGTTFGDNCWIADIVPAPTGVVERASFLVMLSRFKNKAMFKALRRLWKEGDGAEEARIKKILLRATIMDEDLRAEMCRTRMSAWLTQEKYKELFAMYGIQKDVAKPSIYVPMKVQTGGTGRCSH